MTIISLDERKEYVYRICLQASQMRNGLAITKPKIERCAFAWSTPFFYVSAPAISEASTTPKLLKPTTNTPTTVQQRGQVTTVTTVGTKAVNKTPKSPAAPPQTTTPPPLESFPPPERFCESVELRDILWPQTPRGMLVERPCPKGTRGGDTYLLKAVFHLRLFDLLSVCLLFWGKETCSCSLWRLLIIMRINNSSSM